MATSDSPSSCKQTQSTAQVRLLSLWCVSRDICRKLKVQCVEQDLSIAEVIRRLIKDKLMKQNKPAAPEARTKTDLGSQGMARTNVKSSNNLRNQGSEQAFPHPLRRANKLTTFVLTERELSYGKRS